MIKLVLMKVMTRVKYMKIFPNLPPEKLYIADLLRHQGNGITQLDKYYCL